MFAVPRGRMFVMAIPGHSNERLGWALWCRNGGSSVTLLFDALGERVERPYGRPINAKYFSRHQRRVVVTVPPAVEDVVYMLFMYGQRDRALEIAQEKARE